MFAICTTSAAWKPIPTGAVGVARVRTHSRKLSTWASTALSNEPDMRMSGRIFRTRFVDHEVFAAHVHARLVAIELVELIVVQLIARPRS
jgi:hypothetical protein